MMKRAWLAAATVAALAVPAFAAEETVTFPSGAEKGWYWAVMMPPDSVSP